MAELKKTAISSRMTYVEPDSMTRFTSCSGLMVDVGKKVWIDMNMGREATLALLEKDRPDAAFITHYHLDHAVWLQHVALDPAVDIWVPAIETRYLEDLEYVISRTAAVYGDGMVAPWRRFAAEFIGYQPITGMNGFDGTSPWEDFLPDMTAIKTPGHSPGHTSFYFAEEKVLFSGDMGMDRFGPWYGWAECSVPDIVDAILRLDRMDVRLVLTSHGGMVDTDIHGAWMNSLRLLTEREQRLKSFLDEGLSHSDIIARGVFYMEKDKVKEPMRSFLYMWDTAMFNHHLSLIEQGGLRRLFPELESLLR